MVLMGAVLVIVPAQMGIVNAAVSKMVPPATAPNVLAWLLSFGTVGRILGPLWGGNLNPSAVTLWLGMALLPVASMGGLYWQRRFLGVPFAEAEECLLSAPTDNER